MKSIIVSSLLIAAATALPSTHRKRFTPQPGLRTTPVAIANSTGPRPDISNAEPTVYSYNWAGGYIEGSGVTEVYGTVVVPAISIPPGGNPNTVYSGAAWVGIDGDTSSCGSLLQTGITWQIGGGQGATYGAWYEWVPDEALMGFNGFSVNEGDTIIMKVVASSNSGSTGGAAYITNESTGQSISHSFSGDTALKCQTYAEWIVEDLTVNNAFAPFAAFDPVSLTALGWGNDQGTYDISGAGIYNLVASNGNAEAEVSIPNNNQIDVSYMNPN